MAAAYETGRALKTASHFEIDDVIDPATTRELVVGVILRDQQQPASPRRRFVDAR